MVKELMQALTSAVRGKLTRIYARIRMLTDLTYLHTLFTEKLRQFFLNLLDVKPRNSSDYYTLGRWMFSKKLAFACIVVLGAISLWFLYSLLPVRLEGGKQGIPTYRYNALALKSYSGQANILSRAGYTAYTGQLTDGAVCGEGTLYDRNGCVVYTGSFDANMYNGGGRLYYPNADLHYEGTFTDNLFNGKGKLYISGGRLYYEGEFEAGLKSGAGTLYDGNGQRLFTGRFYRDEPVFTDLLSQPAAALGEAFFGIQRVYRSSGSTCIAYPQLDLLYETETPGNSLEEGAVIKTLYQLSGGFRSPEGLLRNRAELDFYFGEPLYEGTSLAVFPEIAAISELRKTAPDVFPSLGRPAFETPFKEVFALTSYVPSGELFILTYEKDSLIYTFYSEEKNQPSLMYSVQADASNSPQAPGLP